MPMREAPLQAFVSCLDDVFGSISLEPDPADVVDNMRSALQAPGRMTPSTGKRLPVCDYLPEAFANARAVPALTGLVDAFTALEPSLSWAKRASGGTLASENWPEGHANATIIGPGGLEHRDDLVIGVSLLAPHVRYPDHNHGPEEVYLALSKGRFRHGQSGWFEPGIGGTFYNEPDIKHAMASDEAPLLAIWCLWVDWPREGGVSAHR